MVISEAQGKPFNPDIYSINIHNVKNIDKNEPDEAPRIKLMT